MPPLPNVPHVLKIEIMGTNSAFPWANVFHMVYSGGPPGAADCQTFANFIYGQWAVNFIPLCPSSTHLTAVKVTDLSSAFGAVGLHGLDTTGTSGGEQIAGNVSFLLSFPVAFRFRGGHPRMYLYVGSDTDILDPGHFKPASVAAFVAAWNAFMGAIIGQVSGSTSLDLQCAVSYINKLVNPVAPFRRAVPLVLDIPFGDVVGHSEYASQRRRIGR